MKARAGDALLAGLATIVAILPLTTLLDSGAWIPGAVCLVGVVAISGMIARVVGLRGWPVAGVQVLAATLTAGGLYGRGHLWHGLPTPETVDVFRRLLAEAVHTVQSYSAPAPATRGIVLAVGAGLALSAIVVDYLAVTRRAPSLAGLPLLATFLVSAANSGSSLHPFFFVTTAACWLLLVARQGTGLLRRWSTTSATALTPVRDPDLQGVSGYAAVARSLGVAAILLAVTVPVVLPHLPTRFLLAGLGRSDSADGPAGGVVGFSQTLDVARDLTSRSSTPVLTYRTTAPTPPPLRVAVSSVYRDGRWVPEDSRAAQVATSEDPPVADPSGLAPDVPRHRYEVDVTTNNLEAPNLAIPYPLAGADLGGTQWGQDPTTQAVLVASRPQQYTATYWQIEPTHDMLAGGVDGAPDQVIRRSDLQLDAASAGRVSTLAATVAAGAANPYEQALAIQEYLRERGGFVYSLTLAAPVRSASGDLLDPISSFLTTKQGYCVQFATTMVMMARSLGIPARMAVGFLPGRVDKGEWTVIAADAHAWPELYLRGLGWVRFEPTPAARSGAPPAYATVLPTGPQGSGTTATQAPGRGGRTPVQQRFDDSRLDAPGPPPAAPKATSWTDRLPRGWALVLLALALGLLGTVVVPLAARWGQRSRVRAAGSDRERVEVQWQELTTHLSDLGMAAPPSRTPRQMQDYYRKETWLGPDAEEALGRVVQTLERARYGRPSSAPLTIEADAATLVRAIAPTRLRRHRLRAALWPRSGVTQVRWAARTAADAVARPWRAATERIRREGDRVRRARDRSGR